MIDREQRFYPGLSHALILVGDGARDIDVRHSFFFGYLLIPLLEMPGTALHLAVFPFIADGSRQHHRVRALGFALLYELPDVPAKGLNGLLFIDHRVPLAADLRHYGLTLWPDSRQ